MGHQCVTVTKDLFYQQLDMLRIHDIF